MKKWPNRFRSIQLTQTTAFIYFFIVFLPHYTVLRYTKNWVEREIQEPGKDHKAGFKGFGSTGVQTTAIKIFNARF